MMDNERRLITSHNVSVVFFHMRQTKGQKANLTLLDLAGFSTGD